MPLLAPTWGRVLPTPSTAIYIARPVSIWVETGTTQVMGGMGAFGQSLATAAEKCGAKIQLGSSVTAIVKTDDRVTGVTLDSGEQISAKLIISSADPSTTFRRLAGLPPDGSGHGKAGGMLSIAKRNRKATSRVLTGLPSFKGLSEAQLTERLVITPSMDGMETALNPMKYRELSELHTL